MSDEWERSALRKEVEVIVVCREQRGREGIRECNGGNDLRPRVDQGSAGLKQGYQHGTG